MERMPSETDGQHAADRAITTQIGNCALALLGGGRRVSSQQRWTAVSCDGDYPGSYPAVITRPLMYAAIGDVAVVIVGPRGPMLVVIVVHVGIFAQCGNQGASFVLFLVRDECLRRSW